MQLSTKNNHEFSGRLYAPGKPQCNFAVNRRLAFNFSLELDGPESCMVEQYVRNFLWNYNAWEPLRVTNPLEVPSLHSGQHSFKGGYFKESSV